MTTREEWLALADMCAKATGASPAIDIDIYTALGEDRGFRVPAYTASLDAIVGLIKATRPAWGWDCSHDVMFKQFPMANVWWSDAAGVHWAGHQLASSPALALCAAYCLARAETAT